MLNKRLRCLKLIVWCMIIISMVEENKYCTDIMEKIVMARDFEPVLNVIFVIMFMLMVML